MKTNITSRLVLVLCVAVALLAGCGGDDDPTTNTCDKSVESYEATLNAFIADPTNKTKCQAFKSEAADLLDCPYLAAGKRKEYEDAVAAISCD